MIRIKYLSHAISGYKDGRGPTREMNGCLFIQDANCRDYDWVLVYDDMPRRNVGSIFKECEELACPRENTILVTAEPPTIKIYPKYFTHQFGYVLTTDLPQYLPHPNHRIGHGCLHWCAGYPEDEVFAQPDYPKSKLISTVCSAKQQKHTLHYRRYNFTKYIASRLPELDWYGRGVKPLGNKYDALSDYRYHIAVENYIEDYHWTDKISDPILGLCLTFYAGDPKLGDYLPPESFIPVPLHDPVETAAIIKEAIANNEYEKRLPAIREARRLIVEKYNMYSQVSALINEVEASRTEKPQVQPFVLKGRRRMRHNPFYAVWGASETLRHKLGFMLHPTKY